jgi:N-acetylglutamate synthase-like GNAT family acetyltransferase
MITTYSNIYFNECKKIYENIYKDNNFLNKIEFIEKNNFIFLCMLENNVIGFASYNFEYTHAVIYLLTIDKKYQNKFYGTELLNHILYEISQNQEIETISIKTYNKKFLEKNGFKLLFDLGNEYIDRYIMEIKIK